MNFTVSGVPRSGTTALARALNLHPRVICGLEYFLSNFDYTNSAAVPALHDKTFRPDYPGAENTRALLEAKGLSVQFYGNKNPRYYQFLERILPQLPDAKHICIYRPSGEFCQSWNRRADDEKDNWHAGMTGMMGVLELIAFALRLGRLTAKNVQFRLYEYHSFFGSDPTLYDGLVEWLGASADQSASEAFRSREFGKIKGDQSPMRGRETDLWKLANCKLLDDILRAAPMTTLDEIAAPLDEYCRLIEPKLPRITAYVAERATPDEKQYLLRERLNLNIVSEDWQKLAA